MLLKEITAFLESQAPLAVQESYDNSGLLVGNPSQDIHKALVSLDCTEAVVDEAIRVGANLIISHHPILFTGLKKITGKTYIERVLIKAIKNDIALYAIHTNLDSMPDGVNAMICHKLGLVDSRILAPKVDTLKKLITFCPTAQADKVRNALFAAGAGHIANYSECSFNTSGTGTFTASENTQAFVGEKHKQHQEAEIRIETIYPLWIEEKLVAALTSNHPYEEVAYDLVSLTNSHTQIGAGMIAELPEAKEAMAFLQQVKETMNCGVIRHTAIQQTMVKKVAVCGGSGSFLLSDAIAAGADVFITSDYKYHQFFDADSKILIADIGHYESEQFTSELIVQKILNKFPTFAVQMCTVNTNPVYYI